VSSATVVHKRECLFKLIVIGDMSTGKTSLIQRYVRDVINLNYKPTLVGSFFLIIEKYYITKFL
jgi:GTPase SAR1 family protein